MLPTEVDQLADTIKECIAIRGIYLLMDERLDLICGPGCSSDLDKPEVTQKLAEFAAAHGWSFTRYRSGFAFWPDSTA